MPSNELEFAKQDREFEKQIDSFANNTIKQVETESKMFGNTVNQITNYAGMR